MRAGVLVAVSLGLVACGDNIKPAPGGSDEDFSPTLPVIEREVFAPTCNYGACHGRNAPAADLDLTPGRSCAELVDAPSCLYTDRRLVVPGDPDASFLVAKLEGILPAEEPDGPCRIRTDEPMPYNARPLPAERIDQVREWIARGASCDDGPGDGPGDPPGDDGEARVVAVTAAGPTVRVGERLQLVVLLGDPAPAAGQTLEVEVSDAALETPAEIWVAPGATMVELEARGVRSSRPLDVIVRGGGAEARTRVQVMGVLLSEILYDVAGADDGQEWIQLVNVGAEPIDLAGYAIGAGRAGYDYTSVTLSGVLAPGGCALVGGPSAAQGGAVYSQVWNFDPDLPNGTSTTGQGTAFGLFESGAVAGGLPIDAVLCGAANGGGLLGPDGAVLAPTCPDVSAGQSVVRRDAGWWQAGAPAPATCEDPL